MVSASRIDLSISCRWPDVNASPTCTCATCVSFLDGFDGLRVWLVCGLDPAARTAEPFVLVVPGESWGVLLVARHRRHVDQQADHREQPQRDAHQDDQRVQGGDRLSLRPPVRWGSDSGRGHGAQKDRRGQRDGSGEASYGGSFQVGDHENKDTEHGLVPATASRSLPPWISSKTPLCVRASTATRVTWSGTSPATRPLPSVRSG